MPKNCPAPRIAQKRSAFSVALTLTSSPLLVISRAARMLSEPYPVRGRKGLFPPPRKYGMAPTVLPFPIAKARIVS